MQKYIIETLKSLNEKDKNQILKINSENLYKNGGELENEGILPHDYIVVARLNEDIIGYAYLKKDFDRKNDMYVCQMAIDKNYQGYGIGTKIYEYIFKHLKGFDSISCHIRIYNPISKSFHEKCGFTVKIDMKYINNYFATKKVTETNLLDLENAKPKEYYYNEKPLTLMGAIIGDIVGSPYEFMSLKLKKFPLFNNYCRFTDDTVITCAIAQSLMDCNGDYTNLDKITIVNMHEIGKYYYNTAGYGGMFYDWLKSGSVKPYGSFGNGSAMRISAVPYIAKSLEEVKELSRKVTEITHNHPEGIKGAEATAVAEWMALNGSSKDEIRDYIDKNYYSMDYDENDLFENYKFEGSCQESVPQSIFAFLVSSSYEDAIRKVISWGGDTDTMGAITGGIAGAYYGIPKEIERKSLEYLDSRMLKIVKDFNKMINNK